MNTSDLLNQHCIPRKGETDRLQGSTVQQLLGALDPAWQIERDGEIRRDFRFKNYYRTMAFVNAVAWVAHDQDHHPDLEVGYGHCLVRFSTHSVGGLSENDFICAARLDALLAES